MFKTNTYFNEKVVSIAYKNEEGTATLGVMAAGEYTFATSSLEHMTVVSGEMEVKIAGKSEFTTYKALETFSIEADSSFEVIVTADTAYKCIYE